MLTFLKQQLKKQNTNIIVITILLLIIAGSFLINHFFFSNIQQVEAWYSDNWLFRQGIPIQNSGAEREDYQVAITIDTSTLIGDGKMQTMCQDMRFASKMTGKELPYWIESGCDSATTKVWVNVDKLPYSESSTNPIINMYYGNPTAPKGENGDETFLFFDDFENDLSKWDIAQRGSTTGTVAIDIDTGTVRITPNPNHTASANIISNQTFTNGVSVEARRKQDTSNYYVDFSLGADYVQDSGGGQSSWHRTTKSSGYYWRGVSTAQSVENGIGKIAPDTNNVVLVDTFAIGSDFSSYQRFQYRYDTSGELWWFLDDVLITSATDTIYLSNDKNIMLNQGEYSSGNGEPQNIDWVFVRKYDEQSTEPSMGTAQSEEQGKGAVAYWNFDEGYGTTAHDQAQNNDGTITGATWKNEDECISGKCLYFDGTSDVVAIPNSVASSTLNFGTDDFTISLWIKTNDTTTNKRIICKRTGTTGYDLFLSDLGEAGNLRVLIGDANGYIYATDLLNDPITDGAWHYLTIIIDRSANQTYAYVDGVRQTPFLDTSGITGSINVTDDLYLGANSGAGGNSFNGHLDEIKFYPYARTATEVKADYLGGLKGKSANIGNTGGLNDGLVMHLKMDEASWDGTANEVVDSSGAGNHGVRVGNANTTSTAKYGMSGDFDGTGDYVTVGDIGDINTVAFWLNNSNATDGILELINNNTYISIASNIITATNFTSPTIYVDGVETTTISSGWHFVAITTDTAISAATVVIGEANTDEMTGHIDDIRIYNRALSAREALQLYETAPPPVLHLKMDEKTGATAYDTSENSNDGTFAGSPEWKSGGECVRGSCLDFDGSSQRLSIADHDTLDIKSAITLSAWVRPDGFTHAGGGTASRIFDKAGAWRIHVGATGGVILTTFGLSDTSETASAIPLNEWIHITATYDQSTGDKIIYYNGIENVRETSITGELTTTATTMYIGDNGGGSRYWDGKIDDVRIYNYARTPKQIAEDMQAGAPVTSNRASSLGGSQVAGGPVLYYDFENISMASISDYSNIRGIVHDKSGRGNHGDVYNATSTPGKFGKALGFDGSGDYVDILNFTSTAQTYTFSMWAKVPDTSATYDYLFHNSGLTLAWFGQSSRQIGFKDAGDWKYFGTSPSDGEWHHLVYLFDSSDSTSKLYIDGSQFGSTLAYTAANLGVATLCSSGSGVITGKLDEFKIYEYLLSEEEIKTEYNQGKVLKVAPSQNPTITGAASGMHPGGNPPIMHLTFDERIGTTSTDKTGNGNDGGRGEGTKAPTWKGAAYCQKGGCLEFDGVDDRVIVADSATLDITNEITVMAWLRADDWTNSSGDSIAIFLDKNNHYRLEILNSGLVNFYTGDLSDTGIASTTVASLGEWIHAVATYSVGDGEKKIYINGILETTETGITGTIATDNEYLALGDKDSGSREFDGKLDDVKIYNRALTQAEVAYEYNGGKPGRSLEI